MISKEQLTALIKSISADWVHDIADFVCYWDINSGSCGDFAYHVMERLPENSGVKMVSTGDFLEEKGLESYGDNGDFSNHVWLILNDEHFDIERPSGVAEFMLLPYFQREIKGKEMNLRDYELYQFLENRTADFPELICNVNEYVENKKETAD